MVRQTLRESLRTGQVADIFITAGVDAIRSRDDWIVFEGDGQDN